MGCGGAAVVAALFVIAFLVARVGGPRHRESGPTPPAHASGTTQERKLRAELAYLNEISEIAWWEVESNNVYIGFSRVPDDPGLVLICQGAALRGNRAIDFGVHVWGSVGAPRGARPDTPGVQWYETTARYGRIER